MTLTFSLGVSWQSMKSVHTNVYTNKNQFNHVLFAQRKINSGKSLRAATVDATVWKDSRWASCRIHKDPFSFQPTNFSVPKTPLACSCRRDSRSVTPGALSIHQQAQCQAYLAGGFLAWRRDLHDLWLVKWMTPACFPVSDGMRGLKRGFHTDPFIRPFTFGSQRKCQTPQWASPPCCASCAVHMSVVPCTDIVSETISRPNWTSSGRGQPAKIWNLKFEDSVVEKPPLTPHLRSVLPSYHILLILFSTSFFTIPTWASSLRDYSEPVC